MASESLGGAAEEELRPAWDTGQCDRSPRPLPARLAVNTTRRSPRPLPVRRAVDVTTQEQALREVEVALVELAGCVVETDKSLAADDRAHGGRGTQAAAPPFLPEWNRQSADLRSLGACVMEGRLLRSRPK